MTMNNMKTKFIKQKQRTTQGQNEEEERNSKQREDALRRVKQEMVGRSWRLVGRNISSNALFSGQQ